MLFSEVACFGRFVAHRPSCEAERDDLKFGYVTKGLDVSSAAATRFV